MTGQVVLAEEELAESLRRYFGHAIDVPRYWRDFLGHPDRRRACYRRQRSAERARRAGEDKFFDPGGSGFLQKRQSAKDIGIDKILLAVRGDVRLVQRCRVDDGAHAEHAAPDEIPIADPADAIGEWRRLDVDA